MEKKTTAKPKKPQTKKAPAKKTKKPKKPTVNEEVKQVVQEEKPIEEIVDTLDADFEEKPEEKGKTKKTKKKLTNDQVYGIIFLCVFLVFGLFAYVKFKNIWISIGLIGLGVISMLLMFFKDRMHFKGKGSSKGDDRCFKELSRLYLEELMTGVDTKNAFFEAYEGLEPSSFKDELNIDDSLKNNSNQDLSNIFAHSKLNKDNLDCV